MRQASARRILCDQLHEVKADLGVRRTRASRDAVENLREVMNVLEKERSK